jgi:hypothetical protein
MSADYDRRKGRRACLRQHAPRAPSLAASSRVESAPPLSDVYRPFEACCVNSRRGPTSIECTVQAQRPPWKARCYAFRTLRRSVIGGLTHRSGAAGGVVFGGPLLGDPDRQQRTAAGSPAGAGAREAIASPTTPPSVHVGNIPTRSRCASRARVRARAVGRPSPIARRAFAARLRLPLPAPAKGRRRSLSWPRT